MMGKHCFAPKYSKMPNRKTSSAQVKITLNPILTQEMDRLCEHLGLPANSVAKLAIRRLAQAELYQNQTASPKTIEEAA